jgi:uncharacterized CHY-type Zn-finger protein
MKEVSMETWLCGKCKTELKHNQCPHVAWLECPECEEAYRAAELNSRAILKN